jgi:hypothetical protein
MAASTSLNRAQRRMRASIAANTRWSKEDPSANAARGQAGLLAKFERDIRAASPDASDAEIARCARSAYKAHMGRLAFASSKARGARKAPPAPKAKPVPAVPAAQPSAEETAAMRAERGKGRKRLHQDRASAIARAASTPRDLRAGNIRGAARDQRKARRTGGDLDAA